MMRQTPGHRLPRGDRLGSAGIRPPRREASFLPTFSRSDSMRLAAFIMTALFVAACASDPFPGWTRPGASQQQMEADVAACKTQAAATPNNSAATTAVTTVHCLVNK